MAVLLLVGCRDVRVQTVNQGTTPISGPNAVIVVRSLHELERLGIRDEGFHFNHEFGVVLLMGPHHATGYHQVIESIHASDDRVRVVAFEEEPADGGEQRPAFRTYTIWIVPNSVYRPGTRVEVVSPDGVPIASTEFSR
jgi:hypothetical protein